MATDRFSDDAELEGDDIAPGSARPKQTRLRDDYDAVELADESEVTSTASVLGGLLLDPEHLSADGEEEVVAATNDELEEVDAFDMSQFRAKEPALRDAYEDFVRLHEKHKKYLTDAETAALMAQVHSPDPEVAMQAEDTLIRHNIKWIVKCLKGAAGAESIRYPGDLRNDLLAEARMGFLDGIRKFNLERAGKNGIKGQEKTVLGYCQIWIAKRVREFLPGERFGLNQDAALDRNKVIKARDELVAQTGKMPSSEEIAVRLEQKARKKLEAKQIAHPTPRQLSRAGALNSDRVDELLQHATSKLSLDAPTGDDGDDGPTMAQYVSTSAQDLDNGMLADELKDGIAARLDKLPNAQRRDGMRMRFGLPSSADAARHPIYNPEEVGVFMGRTRDSIAIYEEEMRQGFLGEEKVAVDDLRAPNLPVSLGQLRAMSTLPDDVRAAIATSVNLLAVARADGVHLDPRAPSAPVGCPLCDGGRTLTVNATAFACSSCDRAGDALDWMMAKRGLTLKDAALEAVLVAMALPSDAVESGTVTVTRDPVRKRRLQQLSS